MAQDLPKYDYIDAIRGIAILLVVFSHVNALVPTSGIFWSLMGQGARGVQLFYIVSFLALFLSFFYRSNKVEEKYPKLNFFIRRFFRIAPMFYIAVIFYSLTYYYFDRVLITETLSHLNFSVILSNMFFVNGFSPYTINSLVPGGWSIAIETISYLFIPFLYFLYTKAKDKKAFIYKTFLWIFFVGLFIKFILIKYPLISISTVAGYSLWDAFLFFFLPSQAFVFILGILAFYKITNKEKESIINKKEIIFIIFTLFASLIARKYLAFNLLPSFIFYSFFFLYFVVFLERIKDKNNIWKKIFINRVTTFFGKISYSMYLLHFAMIFILLKFNLISFILVSKINLYIKFFLAYILLVLFSALISYFTFTFIEKPGMVLGKKLIKKIAS